MYDKQQIFEQALKAIDEWKLIFVDDIVVYLPCSRSTFYSYFPEGSDELDAIKKAMEKHKVSQKAVMRSKWYLDSNPTLQSMLYKLLANKEEREAISMQQVNSSNETTIKVIKVDE